MNNIFDGHVDRGDKYVHTTNDCGCTGTVQPPRRPRCPECGSDNPAESFNTNWNCDNPFHTPTPDTQPSRPVKIDPEIQATISDLPPTPDTTDSSGGNNNE